MRLLDALQDSDFQRDVGTGLRDVANRGVVAGVLGAPVDLITLGMRPLGYRDPEPVMGSEWIGRRMEDRGLVSPERRPAAELLSSLIGPSAIGKVPLLGAMAMSPAGKARLLADLQAGRGSGTYRLGNVTEGQRKALGDLAGHGADSRDVMMTDRALEHIVDRRMDRDGFTAEEIARVAEQALAPRSQVWADPALAHQQPSLINRGVLDGATGKRYDAQMPLRTADGTLEAVSVVPRGLRKNKAPKP